ncbi:hypothetical protein CEXT_674141 [Caerostris extrusa]|uniref:Uncharacterized protein n=1 Tax=Caerostris extrusa TaxID=172846 RepID=A0AAV4UTY7_CAEEX|nr:hypothetical protein CEXT_674141 [Caerostris extrusa]
MHVAIRAVQGTISISVCTPAALEIKYSLVDLMKTLQITRGGAHRSDISSWDACIQTAFICQKFIFRETSGRENQSEAKFRLPFNNCLPKSFVKSTADSTGENSRIP